MDVKRVKENKKQLTTLKALLILGFGIALLVTTIVTMVNDKGKDKEKKENEQVEKKEESK